MENENFIKGRILENRRLEKAGITTSTWAEILRGTSLAPHSNVAQPKVTSLKNVRCIGYRKYNAEKRIGDDRELK